MSASQDPIGQMEPITPHDSNSFDECRGIHVNGAGDAVLTIKGEDRTLTLLAGNYYPYKITAVKSTGTTASGLFALY